MAQSPPPETASPPDSAATYSWEMVLACAVALLLQSRRDTAMLDEIFARATGPSRDEAAMGEVWAYARQTLEPMR